MTFGSTRLRVYEGKTLTTSSLRWKAKRSPVARAVRHSGQAESFRSKLPKRSQGRQRHSALRLATPWNRERDKPKVLKKPSISWYALHPQLHRREMEVLRRISAVDCRSADRFSEVLFTADSPYPRAEIRRALATWAFSARLRGEAEPPEDIAPVIKWLAASTIPVTALADAETSAIHARAILDRLSSKQDGTLAAANTANRKRTVLNNLMTYAALERNLISGNPLKSVTWSRPRKLKTVDPRCVTQFRPGPPTP